MSANNNAEYLDKTGLNKLVDNIQTLVSTEDNKKIDKPSSSVPAGKVLQTDSNHNAVWGDAVPDVSIAAAVSDYLDGKITPGTAITIDDTLTQTDQAADAKATGDAIDDLRDNLVAVSDTQPSSTDNRVWVKETPLAEKTVAEISELEKVSESVAPNYDDLTFPIKAGTICTHNLDLYVAKQDIPTLETWTSGHWSAKTNIAAEVTSLSSAMDNLQDVVNYRITLGTLQNVVPFHVISGNIVTVKAVNGSAITVDKIRFKRSNGTEDYWGISGYTEKVITMTEEFIGVYLTGGTAQDLVIERTGSYLNFQPQIDKLSNDVNENSDAITDINSIVGIDNPTYTSTDGYYINTSGTPASSAPFSYSSPIQVSKGQTVTLIGTGYNDTVAMISTCDSNGSNISPKVISIDSTNRTYTYDVEQDGYVIVCYVRTALHKVTIYTHIISDINHVISQFAEESTVTPANLNVGYIHRNGRIMEGNNFRYTNPIRLENETIEFKATGYSDVVSLLSVCDENGDNRINIVNSTSEEPTKNISYVSNGVTYVILCSNIATPVIYRTIKNISPSYKPFVNLSLFNKFGVIGDSFASGELYFNNTVKDDYSHSWGQIMARNLGTICTNYSRGGLSTRTWLTDSNGLALLNSSDPEDIYYLALGINDSSLGSDYLGSITDITSHSSYTEYPDTFYGNYGKIIEQVQSHAPHSKLVMFMLEHTAPISLVYSAAIKEIAEHYNIAYINPLEDEFFNSKFFWSNMVEGHPIAITYSGMANAYERLLTECIKNNVAYFRDIYWYE